MIKTKGLLALIIGIFSITGILVVANQLNAPSHSQSISSKAEELDSVNAENDACNSFNDTRYANIEIAKTSISTTPNLVAKVSVSPISISGSHLPVVNFARVTVSFDNSKIHLTKNPTLESGWTKPVFVSSKDEANTNGEIIVISTIDANDNAFTKKSALSTLTFAKITPNSSFNTTLRVIPEKSEVGYSPTRIADLTTTNLKVKF